MTSAVLETPPKLSLGAIARDYLQLSKSRIVLMVLITTAAGYLFERIPSTACSCSMRSSARRSSQPATNALTTYVERECDARMHRTRKRSRCRAASHAARGAHLLSAVAVIARSTSA